MSKIKFYKDSAKTQQVYPELDPEDITKFESLEDIENAFPNVSGEDTNITLNHTVEAPMKLSLTPSELEQETTTGKNLLGLIDGAYSAIQGTGISVTVNNGAITVIGTANDVNVIDIPLLKIIPASLGTLTKSLNPSGTYSDIQTSLRDNSGNSVGLWTTNLANITNTISADAYRFRIQINDGITVQTTFQPQVEIGSTATAWEKYTGGYPQPNPDFPSQVHSVSGSNKIEVCKKNFFNKNNVVTQVGYFNSNGEILNGGGSTITRSYIPIIPNTKMFLSGITLENVCYYDKDFKFIEKVNGQISKVINRNAQYIRFQAATNNFNIDTIQLEKGSVATDYESYHGHILSLDLPVENLFNWRNPQTMTLIKSTTRTLNAYPVSDLVLPAGTYTISVPDLTLQNSNYGLAVHMVGVENEGKYFSNKQRTITITEDKTLTYLYFYLNSNDNSNATAIFSQIQIEACGHANAYTPYGTTPLEYCKIGTYSDEFFKNDPSDPNYDSTLELDKWYLKKNVNKVVLDETYYNGKGTTGTNAYYMNINIHTLVDNTKELIFSNMFKPSSFNARANGLDVTYSQNGDLTLRTRNNTLINWSTVENCKEWLNINMPTTYYVLAQPQYILLSDALQHQLDDIYNWVESYPGQTNISQINNDLPFIISAHAMKDLSIIDKYPTEDSEHLVESGGVYEVINDIDTVQQEHTTQIEELQRASLIYNALPKVTGSGTNLTLDNTVESPLELGLNGNTSQETYNGNQLIDFANPTFYNKATSSYLNDTINVIGEAQSYTSVSWDITNLIKNNPNKTLKIKFDNIAITGGIGGVIQLPITRGGSTNYPVLVNRDGEITADYIIPSDTSNITDAKFNIYPNGGSEAQSATITITKPLVYFNNNDTYEPYVGRTTSPNPDYPQRVKVVSGDNIIRVCGKNLWGGFTYNGTSNGIDFILNEDGSVIANGTATGTATSLGSGTATSYNFLAELQAGTYFIKGGVNGDKLVRVCKQDGSVLKNSSNPNGDTFTISEPTKVYVLIRIASGQVCNNEKFKIMLEKNNVSTDYEPYIGIDYKINLPIKNLAYTGWAEDFVSRINDSTKAKLETYDSKNCLYFSANAGYQDYDNKYLFKINWKENTQYTISFDIYTPGSDTNVAVKYTDGTSTYLGTHTANQWTHLTYTSTSGKTIEYIRANYNDRWSRIDLDTFQVEEGTKANSYTPYGTTPIECCKLGSYEDEFVIPSGKNKFDYNYFYNNYITISGSNVGRTPIKLKPNTKYTASINIGTSSSNFAFIVSGNDTSFSASSGVNGIGSSSPRTITTDNDGYATIGIYTSGSSAISINDFINGNVKIQLEEGLTVTKYEPYNNGKWYLKKNVGKVVFDENSGISLNVTTNYTQLAMSGALDVPGTTSSGEGVSNYFRYSYNNVIGNFYYSSNKYVYMVVAPSITNVTEAKAWLSTHNTDVYYPLATPQYILLNDTLQQQLNDIAGAISYQTQTNISQTNNDLPFNIDATAVLDLNTLINAIVSLGGNI